MSDQAPFPVKVVRFRLVAPNTRPLSFAFIRAKLVPRNSTSRNSNTILPTEIETRTNQYGIAELKLYANDALFSDTLYQIEIVYDGKSYKYLIQLLEEMDNVLQFEDLLDRRLLEELMECANRPEGHVKIKGSKLYY